MSTIQTTTAIRWNNNNRLRRRVDNKDNNRTLERCNNNNNNNNNNNTPPSMDTTSIWVHLYYKGEETNDRNAFEIEPPLPKNVGALTKRFLPKLDPAALSEVNVYRPIACANRSRYKPGKPLKEVFDELKNRTPPTSDDHPLIVVAPDPKKQPSAKFEKTLTTIMENVQSLQVSQQSMGIAMHEMKESMPSVVVGHVVIPSRVSQDRGKATVVMNSLGMTLLPSELPDTYDLPKNLKKKGEWIFHWNWNGENPEESTSYEPVCRFLNGLDLIAEDVSGGQNCIERLLYNSEIYTPREQNPFEVNGQKVFLLHRVQGRTDIAVLKQDRNGGEILKHMVSFAIEIKTTKALEKSHDGCMLEAQLQLIGLNAFNTSSSPPVVLTNLARTHKVLYLEYKEGEQWGYVIKAQKCKTFPAAIHLAVQKAKERISAEFSRPTTPDP